MEYENSIYIKRENKIFRGERKTETSGYWYNFDEGRSIGTKGSENGIITKDEEYFDGARITLEKCKVPPYTITLGIYGLTCVTNYYGDIETALENYEILKTKIEKLINTCPSDDNDNYDKKMDLVYKLLEELQN